MIKYWLLASICIGVGLPPLFRAKEMRKITEVSLERTECFGTCPVYKVTLRSDGTLTYFGEKFAARTGKFQAKIWPEDLEKLGKLLDKFAYWDLDSHYTERVTCQPSQIVTIVSDQSTKTVDEYGTSGPDELWAIQTMIDGLVQNAREWKRVKK